MKTPLLALLTGTVVSTAGTAMTVLAIPWFVLHTTGSAAQTGLVAAAEVAGLTVAIGLSGPIVDRIQPRLVSVGSDALAAVAVGLVPALTMLNLLPLWALVLLTAVLGLTRGPGSTAADALLPSAAKLAATPISRASSWFEGSARTGRLIGGVSAGALIAFLGPAQVLYVDAASYLVSALLTAAFIRVHVAREAPKQWSARGHFAELREGYRYLRQDRLLAAIVGMVLVTNMLDGAYSSVLLPSFGTQVLHSSVLLGLVAGTATALLGAAALYLTVTLCPFVFRVWHRLDEPVEEVSGDHVGGAVA